MLILINKKSLEIVVYILEFGELTPKEIRPLALGRKNYMFAGSHEGARYAAMIYSFLGTCKINNVEPFAWLKDVLTRIPDHSIHKIEELLPGYLPENPEQ